MQVCYSRMITKEIKESNFVTLSGEGQNFLISKNESNFSHPLLPRWAGICCWFSRQRYFAAFLEI